MKASDLYRLFFEEASDALIAISLEDFRLIAVNDAFVALSGYTREELEGESFALLNASASGYDLRERSLDADLFKNPGFYNDVVLMSREQHLRMLSVKVRHIQIENRKLALAVLSDDTGRQILIRDLATKHQSLELAYQDLGRTHRELKAAQEKMIQASKLVALGELAAGMSHELNQPLTGIRGYAQEMGDLLKEKKSHKPELTQLSQEIIHNADKMATLLAHLRNFARKEKSDFQNSLDTVPTSEVLANATKLLERQFKNHNISLKIKGPEKTPSISAQAHPIEQILINLLTNARDAIQEKKRSQKDHRGEITIRTSVVGDFVEIRVQDNGCGVPQSAHSQIFDPFFSTKETGQGMGLGLSISFGIAHRFNGEILLEDTSTEGSTFVLRLPKAATPSVASPKKVAA